MRAPRALTNFMRDILFPKSARGSGKVRIKGNPRREGMRKLVREIDAELCYSRPMSDAPAQPLSATEKALKRRMRTREDFNAVTSMDDYIMGRPLLKQRIDAIIAAREAEFLEKEEMGDTEESKTLYLEKKKAAEVEDALKDMMHWFKWNEIESAPEAARAELAEYGKRLMKLMRSLRDIETLEGHWSYTDGSDSLKEHLKPLLEKKLKSLEKRAAQKEYHEL